MLPQGDHLGIPAEEPDHLGREGEEQAAGDEHHDQLQPRNQNRQVPLPLPVPGADGVARQGGGSRLHAVARDIKGGLHGVGHRMGRRSRVAQGVDHGGEDHITQGGGKALGHVGQGHPHDGPEDAPLRSDGKAPGRDDGMTEEGDRDGCAAEAEADGAGQGCAGDPQVRAPHGEAEAEDRDGPAGVDQQEVQQDVQQIDGHAHPHGSPGIARGPEHRAEDHGGCPGQHGQIEDQKIAGGQAPDGLVHLHPDGDAAAESGGKEGEEAARQQHHQHRLGRGPPGPLPLPRSQRLGDEGKKADAEGVDRGAHQPVHRRCGAHGGHGFGAKPAHHGGVDVLDRRLHQLLQHRRPGQGEDHRQKGAVSYKFVTFNHTVPLFVQLRT